MAGEEAFTLIQENASKYFAAVEAFGKHQVGTPEHQTFLSCRYNKD